MARSGAVRCLFGDGDRRMVRLGGFGMTAFNPGLHITVGQPVGLLDRLLMAFKVGSSQRVVDAGLAVPHRSSTAFPRPAPLSDFKTSQRSKTVTRSAENRGSFWEIRLLHGARNPGSRAILKQVFDWNSGISELLVVFDGDRRFRPGAIGWPINAVSMIAPSW